MNKFIKSLVPAPVFRLTLPLVLMPAARRKGINIRVRACTIDLVKGPDILRLSSSHAVYLADILDSFDYYFAAVRSLSVNGKNLVDYSTPRYHDVVGFDAYPILFPSLSEPLITARQYSDFGALSEGMIVFDLGAYSGLISILFSMAVGKTGKVVAVDADTQNIACIQRNFANYRKYSQNQIELLEGAVWEDNNGLEFSSEGNTGASAASIVGRNRGLVRRVPSFTLSAIAEKYQLQKVDFIKCDIEGAEAVIFTDREFFQKFLPRIIMENHRVDGRETTEKCVADLSQYGYRCRTIIQAGVARPLMECLPPGQSPA